MAKWRLPGESISAGEYITVFASAKDRAVAGSPLHTNFKLSSAGEYLALVKPDLTVVHEYAPQFPPQDVDVSYGLTEVAVPLVGSDSSATYHVPNNNQYEATWMDVDFDDGAWQLGLLGLGFGSAEDSGNLTLLDEFDDVDLSGNVVYAINSGEDGPDPTVDVVVNGVTFKNDVKAWANQAGDTNGDGTINWWDTTYNVTNPGKPPGTIAGLTVECSDTDTNGMDHGPYEAQHTFDTSAMFGGAGRSSDADALAERSSAPPVSKTWAALASGT